MRQTAARVAASTPPERVEVPVVPEKLVDTLAELAARAEALAEKAESNE